MRYVVDDIGTVVERMKSDPVLNRLKICPRTYLYGHRLEVNNELKLMSGDIKSKKNDKYPLVFLRLDIAETVRDDVRQLRLNLGIMEFTNEGYNAAQRYQKVFKPILYPLYDSFMRQLFQIGLFFWPLGKYPPHIKYDRPFWGLETQEGNATRIFDDPLDCIEIVDLSINQKINLC